MTLRLSTSETKAVFERKGWDFTDDFRRGCELVPVEEPFTEAQQHGHWLLLSMWLKQSPMPGVTKDDLHQWCCSKHFGHIEREMPDGRIDWIPVRTTTKIWDDGKYKRKKLPLREYQEYIDFIYRTAAEGNVVLPELEKERAA